MNSDLPDPECKQSVAGLATRADGISRKASACEMASDIGSSRGDGCGIQRRRFGFIRDVASHRVDHLRKMEWTSHPASSPLAHLYVRETKSKGRAYASQSPAATLAQPLRARYCDLLQALLLLSQALSQIVVWLSCPIPHIEPIMSRNTSAWVTTPHQSLK